MRTFGRERVAKGSKWKKDYHVHRNFRKVQMWWEEFSDNLLDRGRIKHDTRKEIEKSLNDET